MDLDVLGPAEIVFHQRGRIVSLPIVVALLHLVLHDIIQLADLAAAQTRHRAAREPCWANGIRLLGVALWSLIERALRLLLLIDLLLFPALTSLLSPHEPVTIWRSISWGRRRLSTYRPNPLLGASKLLHHIRDIM